MQNTPHIWSPQASHMAGQSIVKYFGQNLLCCDRDLLIVTSNPLPRPHSELPLAISTVGALQMIGGDCGFTAAGI